MWESTLRDVLTAALLVWALWCALCLLVALADRRLAARIAPPVLRALLVAGAVAGAATPARAAPPERLDPLHGLHLPERPVTTAAVPPTHRPITSPAHVVVPGDSLWSIARDHSPGADDATIAADVRRWHDANRDVIGDDPDLILPGQRLDPPGAR